MTTISAAEKTTQHVLRYTGPQGVYSRKLGKKNTDFYTTPLYRNRDRNTTYILSTTKKSVKKTNEQNVRNPPFLRYLSKCRIIMFVYCIDLRLRKFKS